MSERSLGSSVVEAVELRGVNESFRHDKMEKRFVRRRRERNLLQFFARRVSSTMHFGSGDWFRVLMCM